MSPMSNAVRKWPQLQTISSASSMRNNVMVCSSHELLDYSYADECKAFIRVTSDETQSSMNSPQIRRHFWRRPKFLSRPKILTTLKTNRSYKTSTITCPNDCYYQTE